MAETSNAEKWVQYLSAFDFSAPIDLAVMTKRGNTHRVGGTDWSLPNDELPVYDQNSARNKSARKFCRLFIFLPLSSCP
jgi:hypothetical protein